MWQQSLSNATGLSEGQAVFVWVTHQIEGCGRTVSECLRNAFALYREEMKKAGGRLTIAEQEEWSESLFQGDLVLLVLPPSTRRARDVVRSLADRGEDPLWEEMLERLFPKANAPLP